MLHCDCTHIGSQLLHSFDVVQVEEERDALIKRLSQLETDTATAKTSLEENTVKLQEWGEQKEKVWA